MSAYIRSSESMRSRNNITEELKEKCRTTKFVLNELEIIELELLLDIRDLLFKVLNEEPGIKCQK